MAVVQRTYFRVVQIFKGDIVKDLILRDPRPVTIGEADLFDLVAPLGGSPKATLCRPLDDGRFVLTGPQPGLALTGSITWADGRQQDATQAFTQGAVQLSPGDWALLDVVGSEGLQLFFQYVTLPEKKKAPAVLRPFVNVKDAAVAFVDAGIDQYTLFAGVAVVMFLIICRLNLPHGTTMEPKTSPRFSRFFKMDHAKKQRRIKREKKKTDKDKKKDNAASEASSLTRMKQPDATPRRVEKRRRRSLPSRGSKFRKKGAHLAIDQAFRRSSAVRDMWKSNTVGDMDLNAFSPSDGGPGTNSGPGSGPVDGLAMTTGTGNGDNVGRTDTTGNVGANKTVRERSKLRTRRNRKVRIARLSFKGHTVTGGGLSRGAILSAVRRASWAIKNCYQLAIRKNPGLGDGRVTVKFRISPQGKVKAANVVGNTLSGGGSVGSCVRRAVKRIFKFPPSKAWSVVRFPFFFSSGLKK